MDTIAAENPLPAVMRVQALIPSAVQGPVVINRFADGISPTWSWWVGNVHGGNAYIDRNILPNQWQVSVEFYPAGSTQFERNVAQICVQVDPRGL